MLNRWILPALVLTFGCATRSAPPAAPVDPALSWRADTILAPILAVPTLGTRQFELADSLAGIDPEFDARVAQIVSDTSAPALIRTNAILLLGDRKVEDVGAFLDALAAADERVRAAAVVGLRNYLTTWSTAPSLVQEALDDSSALVQAKALEVLADSDVDALRAYLTTARMPELRKVALDLLQIAENRGARLVPKDPSGRFERVGPDGRTLVFGPDQTWPNWDAYAGELMVIGPRRDTLRVARSVEVVGNVVPAFFSIDGRYLVYESARQIHVRDLQTGTDRRIDDGVAPRTMPFSESFLYLRPVEAPEPVRSGTRLKYKVVRAWFAEDRKKEIGEITATAKADYRGNYSPVRWMRVRETDGAFFLAGETMDPFRLPDPFSEK